MKNNVFNHRHYRTIAAVIHLVADNSTRRLMAGLLGLVFAYDNPRFNLAAWLKACNVVEQPFPTISKEELDKLTEVGGVDQLGR